MWFCVNLIATVFMVCFIILLEINSIENNLCCKKKKHRWWWFAPCLLSNLNLWLYLCSCLLPILFFNLSNWNDNDLAWYRRFNNSCFYAKMRKGNTVPLSFYYLWMSSNVTYYLIRLELFFFICSEQKNKQVFFIVFLFF